MHRAAVNQKNIERLLQNADWAVFNDDDVEDRTSDEDNQSAVSPVGAEDR